MRNYRKTMKKKGGNIVYKCPNPKNKKDCIHRYLQETNITLINISLDGNCFFNSISTYFKLNNKDVSPMELRNQVVTYMEQHRQDYIPFFIVSSENPSVIKATMTRQLNQLKKSGSWNNQLADFIPQEAPKALNINIKLHEISEDGTTISVHILRDDTKSLNTTNTYPTINILRVNKNHYELLLPETSVNNAPYVNNDPHNISSNNSEPNINKPFTNNELKEIQEQFKINTQKNNKNRNEKIRKYYMKRKERNTRKKENNLIKEYERLLNLGVFN